MNRDYVMLQYKLISVPLLVSLVGFILLMMLGTKGIPYAAAGGWLCFLWAADNLMGKSLVGDNALMMHLLPVPARTQVLSKVLILGLWAGTLCSISAFLALRNGGQYIDAEVMGMEGGGGTGMSLFYRGLPHFRYAIDTNPNALDTAVGDLVDGGAGPAQIGLMAVLIPVILFAMGCFFAGILLMTQLHLHPLLKKLPALVASIIGMVLATGVSVGIIFVLNGLEENTFFSLFVLELLLLAFFGGGAWLLGRGAVKRLEKGYDV